MLKRIKQYIDYKGIGIAPFEKSIGMSNASFGKSLKKGGSIGCDKLEKILNTYPDLNPIWVILGKGQMIINELDNRVDGEYHNKDEIINSLKTTIQSQEKTISSQQKLIDMLEGIINKLSQDTDEQKRKAG
jgi:hypothetical protein